MAELKVEMEAEMNRFTGMEAKADADKADADDAEVDKIAGAEAKADADDAKVDAMAKADAAAVETGWLKDGAGVLDMGGV